MGEVIEVVRHDGTILSLSRCRDKLFCFCLFDAYEAYGAIAAVDETVTRKQFAAINEAMKANL